MFKQKEDNTKKKKKILRNNVHICIIRSHAYLHMYVDNKNYGNMNIYNLNAVKQLNRNKKQ